LERKTVSGIMLTLLLTSMLTLVSNVSAVDDLELEMTVSNTTITIGEEIDITLTLRNVGTYAITIAFGTSQAFDVCYCTASGCFEWSDGKWFVMLYWEITLEPGETFSRTLQWNLYQYNRTSGEFIPPEPGTYYLWGVCVGQPGAITSYLTRVRLVGQPVVPAAVVITPNVLNLKSEGEWITAYIELPEGFDVSDIDRTTILLNDTIPVDPLWVDKPLESVVGDYDEDGIPDLMVKFDRQAVIEFLKTKGIAGAEIILTVTGEVNGTPFEGSDTIGVK